MQRRRRWAIPLPVGVADEGGAEAVLRGGAPQALRAEAAEGDAGHAGRHRGRRDHGCRASVEDNGACGVASVQLGGTDRGPTTAARPKPISTELPKPTWLPVVRRLRLPAGAWAICADGLLGGLSPGQAHEVGRGAHEVAGHVEARREDGVPDVGIQEISEGRAIRAGNRVEHSGQPGARRARPRREDVQPAEGPLSPDPTKPGRPGFAACWGPRRAVVTACSARCRPT